MLYAIVQNQKTKEKIEKSFFNGKDLTACYKESDYVVATRLDVERMASGRFRITKEKENPEEKNYFIIFDKEYSEGYGIRIPEERGDIIEVGDGLKMIVIPKPFKSFVTIVEDKILTIIGKEEDYLQCTYEEYDIIISGKVKQQDDEDVIGWNGEDYFVKGFKEIRSIE